MVAAEDPLVRVSRARNPRDDVIDRLYIPIGADLKVNFRRAGSYVVGDWQSAAPTLNSGSVTFSTLIFLLAMSNGLA